MHMRHEKISKATIVMLNNIFSDFPRRFVTLHSGVERARFQNMFFIKYNSSVSSIPVWRA